MAWECSNRKQLTKPVSETNITPLLIQQVYHICTAPNFQVQHLTGWLFCGLYYPIQRKGRDNVLLIAEGLRWRSVRRGFCGTLLMRVVGVGGGRAKRARALAVRRRAPKNAHTRCRPPFCLPLGITPQPGQHRSSGSG